ncbi:MAG: hypothetical protein O9264_16370 [Leptospira sp.]|nr:hypothetical protein [Leptospira sp.]
MKKNLITFISSFLLLSVFETIINQLLLKDTYSSLKEIWRSPEELASKAPIFLAIYLVHSLAFTFLFNQLEKDLDWKKGLSIGITLGLLSRFWYAYTNYIVLPIPNALAFQWFFYGLMELSLIGAIVGGILNKLNHEGKK